MASSNLSLADLAHRKLEAGSRVDMHEMQLLRPNVSNIFLSLLLYGDSSCAVPNPPPEYSLKIL